MADEVVEVAVEVDDPEGDGKVDHVVLHVPRTRTRTRTRGPPTIQPRRGATHAWVGVWCPRVENGTTALRAAAWVSWPHAEPRGRKPKGPCVWCGVGRGQSTTVRAHRSPESLSLQRALQPAAAVALHTAAGSRRVMGVAPRVRPGAGRGRGVHVARRRSRVAGRSLTCSDALPRSKRPFHPYSPSCTLNARSRIVACKQVRPGGAVFSR